MILNEKSEIGLVNFALAQLSIDAVPSLNEKTKVQATMSRMFQIAKETILREYVFDWAHKAEKLVLYADALGGYEKPADYINYIGLGNSCNFCCCASGWQNIEIYTHKSSVREINGRLYIQSCCCDQYEWFHYSFNNQNYSSMPSDLFETIGYKLAYIAAMPLTKNQSLTEYLRQRTDDSLKRAQRHSGLENKQIAAVECPSYPIAPKCGGFF